MRALLIYPEYPDTFWSFKYALKFIRKRAAHPPLGLLTIGAMLPKEWSKRLVDMNVAKLKDKDLVWADCAFISGMVVQKESTRRVITLCKEADLRVVAGGPLFTNEYEAFEEVDHFVLNEAEITLPRFLKDFENGSAQRIYRTEEFADIGQTPAPLWELAMLNRYAGMCIQFSRGCPFNCDFCNVTALFGHQPRIKTSDQVIRELDSLYLQGWRGNIFFVDDNFIGNKEYLKNHLLPALIRWKQGKRGIFFNTEASINLADDDALMAKMVEAGFNSVFIGIETPDKESLVECNKIQNTNRDLVASVRKIQRSGLQVQGGFIVGFDSDTPSIFQRQIDFIQNSGIVTAMVGLLQAPAGTKLYERLKMEGRLLGQMSGNTDGTTNIMPKMGLELLHKGYRSIVHNIYSPRSYYQRIKTFLLEYRLPEIRYSPDLQCLLALFRSAFRLGIVGKERFQYWRLLAWTLLYRRRFLPLAVRLMIYGHHFRRTCEDNNRSSPIRDTPCVL